MNGNTLRTGKCLHCGKKKEHHFFTLIPNQSGFCDHASRRGDLPRMYQDSGLAALDAHKEELYEAAKQLAHLHSCEEEGLLSGLPTPKMWREATSKLWDILNQIEKEK